MEIEKGSLLTDILQGESGVMDECFCDQGNYYPCGNPGSLKYDLRNRAALSTSWFYGYFVFLRLKKALIGYSRRDLSQPETGQIYPVLNGMRSGNLFPMMEFREARHGI